MTAPPAPKYRSSSGCEPGAARWRITPRHALMLAVPCWLGFALVSALVLSGWTAGIDQVGLTFWRDGSTLAPKGSAWLLTLARGLTALGNVGLRYAIAGIAAAALVAARMRREALVFVATILSGWLVEAMLKLVIDRARPSAVTHLIQAGGPSFPSGHSFNAALVYLAMALVFAGFFRKKPARQALIALALVLSLMIAFSRVWLGVHYPSDAAAGWLGGAGWALTAAALFSRPADAAAAATTPDPGD